VDKQIRLFKVHCCQQAKQCGEHGNQGDLNEAAPEEWIAYLDNSINIQRDQCGLIEALLCKLVKSLTGFILFAKYPTSMPMPTRSPLSAAFLTGKLWCLKRKGNKHASGELWVLILQALDYGKQNKKDETRYEGIQQAKSVMFDITARYDRQCCSDHLCSRNWRG